MALAGLVLLCLGLALITAEAFTPTFGALGVAGFIAFIVGADILADPDAPALALSWPVLAAIALTALVLSLLILRLALRTRRHPVVTGKEQMLGLQGKVEDWSGTDGHVFVRGEHWNAVSATPLAPGSSVRVIGIDGLTLTVAAVHPDKP